MNKELEEYKKAIENFRKYIDNLEKQQNYLYNMEDYYKDDIEQNELLLKMLHSVLNYIENSISKENNMCKCCKEIKFLKEIYDKRFTFKAGIVTKSKGGIATHSLYPLNYCPVCGRKLEK